MQSIKNKEKFKTNANKGCSSTFQEPDNIHDLNRCMKNAAGVADSYLSLEENNFYFYLFIYIILRQCTVLASVMESTLLKIPDAITATWDRRTSHCFTTHSAVGKMVKVISKTRGPPL